MPYTAFDTFTYAELEENDDDLEKLRTLVGKITALDFYQPQKGRKRCISAMSGRGGHRDRC
ncbi:Chromate resistance protein ChrB [Phyllobacterium sp. NPDC097923]|uniref:Chromate resistance protein ChrB n=1 Tax=Phyllobacterium sp. NPDC097923 TaxID=3364404 RepID=UPI00383ADA06